MVMGEGEEGDGGRSGGEGGVEVVWDMYGWSKRNTFSYAFYAVPILGSWTYLSKSPILLVDASTHADSSVSQPPWKAQQRYSTASRCSIFTPGARRWVLLVFQSTLYIPREYAKSKCEMLERRRNEKFKTTKPPFVLPESDDRTPSPSPYAPSHQSLLYLIE